MYRFPENGQRLVPLDRCSFGDLGRAVAGVAHPAGWRDGPTIGRTRVRDGEFLHCTV
ncbi:protein of unknown function [Kyrpidia spormannii]|uniref:Uncharacterized protein n=1 Tax=Kyrpidia spormannii TaxID=2055160 RepID=A0ACA8ZAB5_9BACL|nr:protein of unknown function [Kyrpidia spormannii]